MHSVRTTSRFEFCCFRVLAGCGALLPLPFSILDSVKKSHPHPTPGSTEMITSLQVLRGCAFRHTAAFFLFRTGKAKFLSI